MRLSSVGCWQMRASRLRKRESLKETICDTHTTLALKCEEKVYERMTGSAAQGDV